MKDKQDIVRCPDCNASSVFIGPIQPTDQFAGKQLQTTLKGGCLYRCPKCLLGFRWPRLTKSQLDSLYSTGSNQAWSKSVEERQEWRIAYKIIKEKLHNCESILDIGCFEGSFLEPLTTKFKCYGIEIHPNARNVAEEKKISIIGSDFFAWNGKFDCITSFDIIEHIESPQKFLEQCLSCLKPGGRLLVSTGNFESPTFKLMNNYYWYCTIAEHISFVSPNWFAHKARSLNFEIEIKVLFTHNGSSFVQRAKDLLLNTTYLTAPWLFRHLRQIGLGGKDIKHFPELAMYPPNWMSAKDHFMIVLRKI